MGETNREFFARCASGFEDVLAGELRGLRARQVRPLKGGVAFAGEIKDAYRACLWCRTATRIQLVLARVGARDAAELYDGVAAIAWEQHVAPGATIAVHAHGENPNLRNTQFTALKVKDAVCDRLRRVRGERPDVDAKDPDFSIDVSLHKTKATLYLNLSGLSLHRRGYRQEGVQTEAPLKETLAAGILLAAGWRQTARAGSPFIDPMCGSGTLVVEAAMIAADMAPGILREKWGFEGWALHDDAAWADLLAEADDRLETGLATPVRLLANDLDSAAVEIARANAKRAGVEALVEFSVGDASQLDVAGWLQQQAAQASAMTGGKVLSGSAAAASVADGTFSTARQEAGGAAEFRCNETDDHAGVQANASAAKQGGSSHRNPTASAGLMAVNPPYGQRLLTQGELPETYAALACAVDQLPQGWTLAAITPDASLDTALGQTPAQTVSCYNGPIEATLRIYSVAPSQRVELQVTSLSGEERTVVVAERNSEQFAARLRKVARERAKWARKAGVTCYRIYDADLPDYSLSVDLYQGTGPDAGQTFVRVAEYQAPASVDAERAARRFADALVVVPAVLGVDRSHVYSKVRRREKGGGQYRDARKASKIIRVCESGFELEVDLDGYLDTGLFLDHRTTREMVGQMAAGKRFLNLFAYTGTATVHAAGGEAAQTTTVDLSQTYLAWARRNMAANGFTGRRHRFEHADVLEWIGREEKRGGTYDLVFCDPPTFSNSKSMGKRTWSVQRDHVELLAKVARVLSDDGQIVFSCNLRNFKIDADALAQRGLTVRDITASTIPHDFERNSKIHHCYVLTKH